MTLVKYKRPALLDMMAPRVYRRPVQRRFIETDWAPRADVRENENDFQIFVELPGLEKKDIELLFKENVLTLKGEKKNTDEKSDGARYIRERSFGKFERNYRFSVDVQDDKIKASFKNGVLTVSIPKTPETAPSKVEIK